jgi:hypothetical protein
MVHERTPVGVNPAFDESKEHCKSAPSVMNGAFCCSEIIAIFIGIFVLVYEHVKIDVEEEPRKGKGFERWVQEAVVAAMTDRDRITQIGPFPCHSSIMLSSVE